MDLRDFCSLAFSRNAVVFFLAVSFCSITNKTAKQRNSKSYKVVIDAEKRPRRHARRYNFPSCNEVAVLLVGKQNGKRDIVLRTQDNTLRKISETHRSYDPLQYPILFPRGEDGFSFAQPSPVREKMTPMKFYAYRLMVRCQPDFNTLLRCRRAMKQYVVLCASLTN